jgi:hypothetical protein
MYMLVVIKGYFGIPGVISPTGYVKPLLGLGMIAVVVSLCERKGGRGHIFILGK